MDFDFIESQIKDILQVVPIQAVQEDWNWKRGVWTARIKKDLCNLSHELGYSVACSGYDQADDREWLYDMVWWKQDGPYMSRIALVLESEWNPEIPLDGDFLKLMLARADHHVWIFQAITEAAICSVIDSCIEHLRHFEGLVTGDRFLFAGLSWNPRQFYFQLYIHP